MKYLSRKVKTNEKIRLPQSREVQEVLTPWLASKQHIVILVTPSGHPYTARHFRHAMRDAALPADCTLHGLRYTAAVILRELGCDAPVIASITGHRTAEMTRKYSEKRRNSPLANRRLDAARGTEP